MPFESPWDPPIEWQGMLDDPAPVQESSTLAIPPGAEWEPPPEFLPPEPLDPQFLESPVELAPEPPQVEEPAAQNAVTQAPVPTEAPSDPYEAAAQAEIQASQAKAAQAEQKAADLYQASLERQWGEDRAQRDFQATQVQHRQRMLEINQEIDEVANTRVDPRRRFRNAEFPEKIAWLFASGIGGLLNPGGRNSSLEAMEREIDRDIQAQMQDLETRRFGVQSKRTMLQDEILMGRDAHEATLKHLAATWENTAQQIEATAMSFQSPIVHAEGAKQAALARQKGLEKRLELDQWKAEQGLRELSLVEQKRHARATEALTRRGQDLEAAEAELRARATGATAMDKVVETAIPSLSDFSKGPSGIVRATSTEAANKVQERLARVQGITQGFDRLKELYSTVGQWGARTSSPEAKEADGLRNLLINELAVSTGQGAVGREEYDRFKKIVGDVKAFRDQEQLLSGIRSQLVRSANADLKQKVIYADGRAFEGHWEPPPLREEGFTPKQTVEQTYGSMLGGVGVSVPDPKPELPARPLDPSEDVGTAAARAQERADRKRSLLQRGWSDQEAEKFLRERGF